MPILDDTSGAEINFLIRLKLTTVQPNPMSFTKYFAFTFKLADLF